MRASRVTTILIVVPVVAATAAAVGYGYVKTQRAAFQTTADDVEKALYGGVAGPMELRGRTRVYVGSSWRTSETVTREANGRALITIGEGEDTVTMLDDGERLWQLGDPPALIGSSSRKIDWAPFRAAYRFRVGPEGQRTIAGRTAQAIRLVNRRTGRPAEVLWVTLPEWLLLGRETYDADGHLVSASEVTEFRTVASGEIEREIEEAVARLPKQSPERSLTEAQFADQAGFTPAAPQYLPPGYRETGLYARRCPHGRTYAERRYFDGLRVLSVYQRPGGGPGGGGGRGFGHRRGQALHEDTAGPALIDQGQAKTVRAQRGRTRVFVTGDLTQDEILQVVNGIP